MLDGPVGSDPGLYPKSRARSLPELIVTQAAVYAVIRLLTPTDCRRSLLQKVWFINRYNAVRLTKALLVRTWVSPFAGK